MALASIVLQAIPIVLTVIHRHEDEQRRRQEEERRRQEEDRRLRLAESAVALTREVLAREMRAELEAGIRFPEDVPGKVRVALVESVVEEGVEEANRIQRKS